MLRASVLILIVLLAACTRPLDPRFAAPPPLEAGVSQALAQWRAETIADVEYDLHLALPAAAEQPIAGKLLVQFDLAAVTGAVPLDFRESTDKLHGLRVNGHDAPIRHDAEHLMLPAPLLQAGRNSVEIAFTAGDSSLNRNPDFLYTLFVPDRARTAFPVFDQPDLKARYRLSLEAPDGWEVLAQAPVVATSTAVRRTTHEFAQSEPVSSYLFSFVAGNFQRETRSVNGREMTMLYRETDADKIARNMDEIFRLHGEALAWLEDYTGIPYPYAKFDFAAIPAYQYGGMEHPGAIQYRERALFLDEDPSQNELLRRASLIAHETAHMWFGDLVTMRWFDDVWTKEVFANFMAAKIVNPSFPDIDHELAFVLDHYPSAYSVDRTEGANAIRQPLANLDQAGSLYGAIIYDKAPIMMRQLELVLGEDAFREGMREYLTRFAGGNASWPELIEILDRRTEIDLAAWSEVWVNTAGRPHYLRGENGSFRQVDPAGLERSWAQRFTVKPGPAGSDTPLSAIPMSGPLLFNADGKGYGLFPVDPEIVVRMWDGLSDLEKGAQLVNLYEQMLEGHPQLAPQAYYGFLFARAPAEPNELLQQEMLGQMSDIYWTLLTQQDRAAQAPQVEAALWRVVEASHLPASTRKQVFDALRGFALTAPTLARLKAIWAGEQALPGIALSERERISLAASLAIRLPSEAEAILDAQATQISNPDEARRFAFQRPSLAPDPEVRGAFFGSLAEADNRANENWVLGAVGNLHHPLRTAQSQAYVLPSLELLEEIQQSGDIFFPGSWASATLGNHTSPEVAAIVRRFLAERPDYNPQLRLKILQAADPVFRAAQLRAQ